MTAAERPGAADEDDLTRAARTQEALHLVPGLLVSASGALGELVDGPVDVGVVGGVIAPQRVDDLTGVPVGRTTMVRLR